MHIGGSDNAPEIKSNKTPLEKFANFKYLGSIKTEDGTCSKDIKARITMAEQKMVQLTNIWKDRGIQATLKMKLLKCLIWSVVLYGSEAWTLRKADKNRIEAAEMWFYRRLLRISWTERRTNESILHEVASTRQLLSHMEPKKTKICRPCN